MPRRERTEVVERASTCAARERPGGLRVAPTVVVLRKDNRERTATVTLLSKDKKMKTKASKLPSCR